jgi:hypothetical protein
VTEVCRVAWCLDVINGLRALLGPVVSSLLICRFSGCIADNSQSLALFLPDEFVKRSPFRPAERCVHRARGSVHRCVGHDMIHVIDPHGTMRVDTSTNPQPLRTTRLPNYPTPLINIVKRGSSDHDRTVAT